MAPAPMTPCAAAWAMGVRTTDVCTESVTSTPGSQVTTAGKIYHMSVFIDYVIHEKQNFLLYTVILFSTVWLSMFSPG